MFQTLFFSLIIIAVSMLLLSIAVLLKRDGRFPSMHIHDSMAMKERGIGCVLEQDKKQRKR